MANWGALSLVHGALGSPGGYSRLTSHHLDSLWASWGFSGSEEVRSSLYHVGIPLKGFSAESFELNAMLHKDGCCQQKLRDYSSVPKTWGTVYCLHRQHCNRNRTRPHKWLIWTPLHMHQLWKPDFMSKEFSMLLSKQCDTPISITNITNSHLHMNHTGNPGQRL